jgi:hypothetical protein
LATSVFSAVFFGSAGFGAAIVAGMTPTGPATYAAMRAVGDPAELTRTGLVFT